MNIPYGGYIIYEYTQNPLQFVKWNYAEFQVNMLAEDQGATMSGNLEKKCDRPRN